MSIIKTGLAASNLQVGGPQRKVEYVNGRWYVTFQQNNEIYYVKSTDSSGTAWETPIQLSNSRGDAYSPVMKVAGNIIYVAWNQTVDDGLYYRIINTGNGDALSPIYVDNIGKIGFQNNVVNDIYIDGGTLYLTHCNATYPVYKTTNNTTFNNITPSSLHSNRTALFEKSGSNLWLIQAAFSTLTAGNVIPYNGTTWGTKSSTFTLDSKYKNSLSFVGYNDKLFLSYNNAGTIKIYAYDGTSWFASTTDVATGAKTSTSETDGGQATSIFVDKNSGDVYVFYIKSTGVFYKKSTDLKNVTAASPSCSWGSETSLGYAGGQTWVSTNQSSTLKLGAVVMNGTSLEFIEVLSNLTPGATTGYEHRGYRIAAEGTTCDSRKFRIKTDEYTYDNRGFRIQVLPTDRENRKFIIKTDNLAYALWDFIVTASYENYENRGFRIYADNPAWETRGFFIRPENTGYEHRGFWIKVETEGGGWETRSFRITLWDTANENRGFIIRAEEIARDSCFFRIKVEQTTYDSRKFRLFVTTPTYADRRFRIWVEETARDNRGFWLKVTEPPGLVTDYASRGFFIKLISEWGEETDRSTIYTETADKETTWTEQTDKTTSWK